MIQSKSTNNYIKLKWKLATALGGIHQIISICLYLSDTLEK